MKEDDSVISIGYFPTPLPNEDFRSILYRYHLCSLNPELTDTNKELFDSKTEFTVFPRGLEVMLRKLPLSYKFTVKSIINNYTLLPLLLPFISERRKEEVLNDIYYGGGLAESCVGKLVGNKYGKSVSELIKYCPSCMKEDMSNYGCSYIHREHQIAFIYNCNKHSVKLISHCDDCGVELKYSSVTGKCKNGHRLEFRNNNDDNDVFEKNLYKDLHFLISNSNDIKFWLIKQRYLEYLSSRGYLEFEGKRIRRKIFIRDFTAAYTPEQFTRLGIDVEHITQRNTLERVFWDDPMVINLPLILLIIRFLAGSLENFILIGIPYSCEIPFGTGPWSCENKHCPSYKKMTIHRCNRVDKGFGRVSCTFICEDCQVGYVIEWKLRTVAKEKKHKKIIYSKEKEDLVIQFLEERRPYKEIAGKLYCSVDYVKRVGKEYLNQQKTGVLSTYNEVAATVEINQDNFKKKIYRRVLQRVLNDYPRLNRYQLCLKCRKAYMWLKHNDSIWFEQHLPPSKSFKRFDWNEVDEALAIRVKEVAQQLKLSNPSTQVRRYTIMSALSNNENGRLKNYIQHLPKSDQALIECAETKEQYQIRHLPALVWQLKTYYNYREVTIESIQAYRRSYRGITDDFKHVLREKLKEINEQWDAVNYK
nr:TnsD family transposase [Brevibacillus laterosporus]